MSHGSVQLYYRVALPAPQTHLFEVTLQIQNWQADWLSLKMPVWTPGSYLVREYARHLQDFAAVSPDRKPLPWQKVSKNHWQVDVCGQERLEIHYRIYANDLSVRTNHLDQSHGYFNGAALFFYIPGYEQTPLQVEIVPPVADWRVATALPAVAGKKLVFEAADFDTLVDSPFEIGRYALYHFEAADKPHQLAVWGEGNLDADRVIADLQKIIQVEADLFGGLPYDRYLFLVHLAGQSFGGLEHKYCCSLIYQRFGFRTPEKYQRFLQLAAHEFFHLWNVKRIRPRELEQFDYDQENYSPSLWFSEGTTSYYDLIIPYRAGLYDVRTYLTALGKEISRYLTTPGRWVQPLSESSFDAWIKLYRPDANTPNSQISYYLKGEMLSLLLDLLIRSRQGNQRSLDDVLRQLWEQFGKPELGFTAADLEAVVQAIADTDLTDFFQRFLHGTEELPFNQFLAPFGLVLQPEVDGIPYLGLSLKTEQGREMVKLVESGSPAQKAGIDAGDELLAIAGWRVSADQLGDRLRDYQPGDTVPFAWFHQDQLCIRSLVLESPRPSRYQLVPVNQPSAIQAQNFLGWLGASISEV